MSKIIVAVAADWVHPVCWSTNCDNQYSVSSFRLTPQRVEEIKSQQRDWDQALELWMKGQHPKQLSGEYGKYDIFEEVEGGRPQLSGYLPDWTEEEKTHLCLFCSRYGETKSPLFPTVECLARFLVHEWRNATRYVWNPSTGKAERQASPASYAETLAFVVSGVLEYESARLLEKLSENIDAWPEFDYSTAPSPCDPWPASLKNKEVILPYLEARRKGV